jgi:F-type H+-transporting ATPase subunit delta
MNSSERIAVERYANAYDRLSTSGEQARSRAEQLLVAAESLAVASHFMASPKVSVAQKKELVLTALGAYPTAAKFIVVLLEAQRYILLNAVAQLVCALADERLGIKPAVIYSAKELTLRQQTETKQALALRYGSKIKAVFKTEKDLLGGLKIVCDGELIDGSLQGRLAKLEQEISR